VADAINGASTKIYERALEEPILKGMGTTATVLKIIDNYAYCGHVGDSRLYLVRCGYIYQITVDHSLVSDQLRAGLLTKEEAERHHLRNVITRSVGYQENEEVDTFVFPLENEDLLLLCSDGLHGRLNEQDLSNILSKDGINGLKTLIQLANDRGGDDNVTAIIVQAKSSP
jgi:protein phosphatase